MENKEVSKYRLSAKRTKTLNNRRKTSEHRNADKISYNNKLTLEELMESLLKLTY